MGLLGSDRGSGGLYALVDVDLCEARGLDVGAILRLVLQGGPACLQLRAKSWTDQAYLEQLTQLRRDRDDLCPETLLFANDRADLAQMSGVDGVHVGQSDLPVSAVRAAFPALRIGLSTHSAEQLKLGAEQRPDYLALGPVFSTSTKKNHEPELGLNGFRRAAGGIAESGIPLVAIGGLGREHARALVPPAQAIAVASALLEGATRDRLSTVPETVRRWSQTLRECLGA